MIRLVQVEYTFLLKKCYVYSRALHLVHRFLELILEESVLNKKSEDLSGLLLTAYNETLHQHHGWMAQQLFTVKYY